MEAALVTDFSMRDIQAPIAKRTIWIVSGIINFALFREGTMPRFQDLTAQSVCVDSSYYNLTRAGIIAGETR